MENSNSQTVTLKLKKSYIAAIGIALVVVSCVVAVYFVVYAPQPSGYSEMYLFDAQNQAVNYPQVLVVNQNSTFNQQILVVNHIPNPTDQKPLEYQVQVKIVEDTISFPVDAPADKTYNFSLKYEESWSSQVPISINTLGSYSVVFELYSKNGENYLFTNNFCVLHLEVIAGSV
ncbi:MAG: DUF1616 domain-containing protein [Candidatus Bathyarchaeia archaeon]|jgi:uncharacterized membrane protein